MVLIILTRGRVGSKIYRVFKLTFIPLGISKIYDQPANGFGFWLYSLTKYESKIDFYTWTYNSNLTC